VGVVIALLKKGDMTVRELVAEASALAAAALEAKNDATLNELWESLELLYHNAKLAIGDTAEGLSLDGEVKTRDRIASLANGIVLACDVINLD
jgi:hypothetical protein